MLLFDLLQVAAGQSTAPEDFRFEHITVDQGLAHSDAMAVVQDQAGFIWVGTNRGIDRYDGYSLKPYSLPVNPRNGISANRIKVLHVAANGRLWAGTERAGLSWYDPTADRLLSFNEQQISDTHRPLIRRLSQSIITAITSDKRGRLWIGTEHDGLFVLAFDQQGHLSSIRQAPASAGAVSTYQALYVVADTEGKIRVGSSNYGLRVIQPTSPDLAAEATPITSAVQALHLDFRGDLWVGTERQVFWVSSTNRRLVRELAAHIQPQIYSQLQSLLLDSFGRLWVGTTYGLYVWEAGPVTGARPPLRATRPTLLLPESGEPFSINAERVHQVFEDHNQIVWLCTSAGGLNKVDLRQKPFSRLRRQFTSPATLPNNYVNTIYKEEGRNILWFGTRNGVSGYNLKSKTYRSYLSQTGAGSPLGVDVASIVETSNGALWFGSRGQGLII